MSSAPSPEQAAWLASKERHRRTGNHRAFVGPEELYDVVGSLQLDVLTTLGLREHHHLLDVGCGSLRAGRLLIPYLLPDRYCGIEPERWLVEAGLRVELGEEVARAKRPRFHHDDQFALGAFGQAFDVILAQSIFSHASERQIARCLAAARAVMRPGARFVATYARGSACYEGDAWAHCARYTAERMQELAREHGLDCRPVDREHPTGQQWILLTRREGGS